MSSAPRLYYSVIISCPCSVQLLYADTIHLFSPDYYCPPLYIMIPHLCHAFFFIRHHPPSINHRNIQSLLPQCIPLNITAPNPLHYTPLTRCHITPPPQTLLTLTIALPFDNKHSNTHHFHPISLTIATTTPLYDADCSETLPGRPPAYLSQTAANPATPPLPYCLPC